MWWSQVRIREMHHDQHRGKEHFFTPALSTGTDCPGRLWHPVSSLEIFSAQLENSLSNLIKLCSEHGFQVPYDLNYSDCWINQPPAEHLNHHHAEPRIAASWEVQTKGCRLRSLPEDARCGEPDMIWLSASGNCGQAAQSCQECCTKCLYQIALIWTETDSKCWKLPVSNSSFCRYLDDLHSSGWSYTIWEDKKSQIHFSWQRLEEEKQEVVITAELKQKLVSLNCVYCVVFQQVSRKRSFCAGRKRCKVSAVPSCPPAMLQHEVSMLKKTLP